MLLDGTHRTSDFFVLYYQLFGTHKVVWKQNYRVN